MQEITLRPFSLKDKGRFDKEYLKLEYPLAEHSFSWLYLWSDCYKNMQWAAINDNLCLFNTFEGTRSIWGPLFPGNKLKETLEICFDLCNNENKRNNASQFTSLLYIPEELKENYEKTQGFELKEQNQDYWYRRIELIELTGERYSKKRNHRNHFVSSNSYSVEDYDREKHQAGCIELLDKWIAHKKEHVKPEYHATLSYEYDANKKGLELAKEFGLIGIVVYVNGSIEGYSFGEKANAIVSTAFFEKTNVAIRGLSVFIYCEFAKKCDTEFINAGEDWDVDYLKDIKQDYLPCMVRKSYKLEKI